MSALQENRRVWHVIAPSRHTEMGKQRTFQIVNSLIHLNGFTHGRTLIGTKKVAQFLEIGFVFIEWLSTTIAAFRFRCHDVYRQYLDLLDQANVYDGAAASTGWFRVATGTSSRRSHSATRSTERLKSMRWNKSRRMDGVTTNYNSTCTYVRTTWRSYATLP